MQFVGAVVDLTPAAPFPMGGHDGPARLTRSSHGRLEANLVVLGHGQQAVALVSIDTLFVGADLRDVAYKALEARFGLPPERILVLASHTHSAPMVDRSKPNLGPTDPLALQEWSDGLNGLVADVGPSRDAVSARQGSGVSDRAVNRRLPWPLPSVARLLGKRKGGIYMCDNPDGPRDPVIRTCVWLDEQGVPLGALWSFACHPVGFPDPDTSSADYIGVVREALRGQLGARVPVIFAPGCMGDVRPRAPRPWASPGRLGHIAVFGPSLVGFEREEWDSWASGLAAEVCEIDCAGRTAAFRDHGVAAARSSIPIADIFSGECPVPELVAKTLRVPGVGRIITLSCEPVTAIAGLVRGEPSDLVLGYEGDVFGYLPTDAMVREGGYEAERFMPYFGLRGSWRSRLDEKIAALGASLRQ